MNKFILKDLDGKYKVKYHSDREGCDFYDLVDAELTMEDGKAKGSDAGGCIWEVDMTLTQDNRVSFTATVDAEEAAPGVFLMTPDLQRTRDKQHYAGELQINLINDKTKISGNVKHGNFSISVQLNKQ